MLHGLLNMSPVSLGHMVDRPDAGMYKMLGVSRLILLLTVNHSVLGSATLTWTHYAIILSWLCQINYTHFEQFYASSVI